MCAPVFLWDGVTIPQSASLTAPFTQGSLPYGFLVVPHPSFFATGCKKIRLLPREGLKTA